MDDERKFKIELFGGWSIDSDGVFSKPGYGEFWPSEDSWEVWDSYGHYYAVHGDVYSCIETLYMAYHKHEDES